MSMRMSSPRRRNGGLKKLSPQRKSLDAELYGLGHTLRHLQPPGGRETGVCDVMSDLPQEVATPRKKVKDYLKSNVFDCSELPPSRPVTPARENTQGRLFPESPPDKVKYVHNRLKSTVFDPDPPKKPRALLVKKNPITGERCKALDESQSLRKRNVRNPITFEGVTERCIPSRSKQPPGGKCSLVLEYIE